MSVTVYCGYDAIGEMRNGQGIESAGSVTFRPATDDPDELTTYDTSMAFTEAFRAVMDHVASEFDDDEFYEVTITIRNVRWVSDDSDER